MKKTIYPFLLILLLFSCRSSRVSSDNFDFTLAFGSCNKQDEPQPLWNAILKNKPDVFLWGGDNIYSDTDDPTQMKADYKKQKNLPGYQNFVKNVPVLATWDDHDYGLNDGGREWHFKEKSQQLFLDFMDVPEDSPRRRREGVYSSKVFEMPEGSIKVILLDTRYFRSPLKESPDPDKRYAKSEGSMLGEQQWQWLEQELRESKANFNVILSSVQVLSGEHGFETWGNFPSEVEKLEKLIVDSEAENVILLSGDRHFSEYSIAEVAGLEDPLMDFTSSGLTHTYEEFSGEYNPYRKGEVMNKKSFGLLRFDLDTGVVVFEMRGKNNKLYQDYRIDYK